MVAPVGPLVTGRTVIDSIGDIYQYTPPTLTPSSPPPVPPLVVRRIATDSAGDVFEYTPPTLTQRSLPPPPVNSSPPAIAVVSGGPVPGTQLVRTNPGTWVPPGPYANQWQSGGVNIPGATTAGYVIQASDVGNLITLVVTVTNEGGSVPATSNAIGPITPAAPVNTSPPVIGGSTVVGNAATVSSVGSWNPSTGIAMHYQWRSGATNVGTSSTVYNIQASDEGNMLTCIVTATNAGGSTPATSNAIGPVTAS